jgi:hypothetical protein
VDLDEVLCRAVDTDDILHSILFNAVASTIPKWQMFKLLSRVQLLIRFVDLDEILYGGGGI